MRELQNKNATDRMLAAQRKTQAQELIKNAKLQESRLVRKRKEEDKQELMN